MRREDAVTQPLPLDAVLANAPAKDGPFFAVPKVLDTGMGGG
ncbi:MAG TPA: Asp-tRNA(Asn)/Glu-tRNA(Gln) amidotransferase subunit GatC [Phycisphaerae bacterium]|nr:Asp-tRNA(Asn)/Glu-tRNA(Gln) amidotransferase subunit GatC [Phycisphaerae bacterium]